MNHQWYLYIGSALLLTMAINVVTPHLSIVAKGVVQPLLLCYDRCACGAAAGCKYDKHHSKKSTQSEFESLFFGTEFRIAQRYGQLLTTVFIVAIFGGAMPVLYPIGAATFATTYFVDKFALLRGVYARPAALDSTLNHSITTRYP